MGHGSGHRSGRQLQLLGSIDAAAPKDAFRIARVCDPLAVSREINFPTRKRIQKGNELARFEIESLQLRPLLFANHKHTVAAERRDRTAVAEWARRDRQRIRINLVNSAVLPQSPDIATPIVKARKKIIAAVCAPPPTTFARVLMECRGKQWMQAFAIGAHFPETV